MSQKVLQFIEIDVDYCSLTYGVDPCRASLVDNITNTVLLLHNDGAEGSTTITDTSPSDHGNATVNGAVAFITQLNKKFGSASLVLSSSSYITYADHADFNFGSGNFTIEVFVRLGATGVQYALFGKNNVSLDNGYGLYANADGSIACYWLPSDATFTGITSAAGLFADNSTFHHVAFQREGTVISLWFDGVRVQTGSIGASASIVTNTNVLAFGKLGEFGSLFFAGWLDEIRISKGVARFPGSTTFTPPTTAYNEIVGTRKCFNTLATCQDRDDFTNNPVTMRFAVPTSYIPADIECIPSIKTIDFDPATISLGKDLGQRATLTVNFDDHRHSDTGEGFDKYLADRTYDPYSQGTFWGKFAARHPFVRGRPLRWIVGTDDQDLADMETRHFIIDSFSGPTNNGVFKLIAKDLLKLADGDRAMAPAVSEGYLVADITNVATTFTLSPAGIGATYPASGYVAIGGSEIVSFTRSSDVMTITRGQLGTTAAAHQAQDRAQLVLRYSGVSPEIIIADLLETYAAVDASYIPLTDWTTEVSSYLNRLYTATIAQPTAVNTLISELIEQAGLSMWWDDREQEIGLLVLRGLIYTNYLFSQDNMQADTLDVTEQPDKRLSQVHTYFGQINPLTSLTDKANFRSASIITDAQSESDYGSAMIKEIFSRWIPALGRTIADRLGDILIGRFKDPPRKLKFSVLRNSIPEVMLAQGYQAQAWPLQQDTGEAETVNLQVTRLRPNPDLIEVEAEEVLFTAPVEDLTTRRIIVDANIHDINLRTAHDALFPAPESGITVVLTVNSGVILGSTSETTPALNIGTWPAGVTIIVHVAGRIQGHGGAGGSFATSVGAQGGTAIFTTTAIFLSSVGEIWGGGGGGGGGVNAFSGGLGVVFGGSGGAGYDPGAGGAGSNGGQSGFTGTTEAGGATNVYGGAGGGPGAAGASGSGAIVAFAGGAAGYSINGVTFCSTGSWDGTTFTGGVLGGSLLGPTIN